MLSKKTLRQHRWFSDQPSVVAPAAFSRPIKAEDAVLCFSPHIYSHLLSSFGLQDGRPGPQFPGALESALDESLAIYLGCFGAPAAAALMEALQASGVARFVMVGQAGAISPRLAIGDLFLPTWGVREEGTSYHYLPAEHTCRASEELLAVVKGYLAGIEVVEGGIWTTDALFRETREKARIFAEGDALAVEMECTALMAVAAYRDVHFAAALVITDELLSGKWVQGFRSEEVAQSQGHLCQALAEGFRQRGRFSKG